MNNHEINLLPEWALQSKRRRRAVIQMAFVQATIFLALILSVVVISVWEGRALARVYLLHGQLQNIDPTWEQTAADAAAARAQSAQMEEFLQMHTTYPFDPAWLDAIVESVPVGTQLLRMEYSNAQLLLTAQTTDISLAEIHRRNIINPDELIFYDARLGVVTGIGDGLYTYELRIQVSR